MSFISALNFFPHCFGLYSYWILPFILFIDVFREGMGWWRWHLRLKVQWGFLWLDLQSPDSGSLGHLFQGGQWRPNTQHTFSTSGCSERCGDGCSVGWATLTKFSPSVLCCQQRGLGDPRHSCVENRGGSWNMGLLSWWSQRNSMLCFHKCKYSSQPVICYKTTFFP